jgi:hypothetical protein
MSSGEWNRLDVWSPTSEASFVIGTEKGRFYKKPGDVHHNSFMGDAGVTT